MACEGFLSQMSNDTQIQLVNNCSEQATSNGTDIFVLDDDGLYKVPTGIVILLSLFYGTISVAAVIGNSLVIWIIITSRRMHNVTHYFIANLALADIVIGLFSIPFQFQAALLQRWNLPYFMCPFCPFVQTLSVSVSIFTLTAIAIDRHRAVLKPLSTRPSKMKAKIVIALIWIISALLGLPMALALRVRVIRERDHSGRIHYRPFCENRNFSSGTMMYYRCLLFLLQYLMPLCIISCAYIRMAHRLWDAKAPGNAEGNRDANILKNKKKVIKMLVIVVTLFALCWLPLQTYNFLQEIIPEINDYRYINIIWFSFDWLAMSNSCYNPFIYGIYNEKFRREFQIRFPAFRSTHCSPGTTYSESADLDRTGQSFTNSKMSMRLAHEVNDWPRKYSSTRLTEKQMGSRYGNLRKSIHEHQIPRRSTSKNYFDLRERGNHSRYMRTRNLIRNCESSPTQSNRSDDENTEELVMIGRNRCETPHCPLYGSKEQLFDNDDDDSSQSTRPCQI